MGWGDNMTKSANAIGALLPLGYFLLGIFQLAAIMEGAQAWWGLGNVSSFLVGALLAYVPVVGTVAGITGAHAGFGWSWPVSLLLFLWPYALLLLAMAWGSLSTKSQSRS